MRGRRAAHLHRRRCFLAEFKQLLIALFDLLVERLVLNLQLLEIDQVQAIGELFFLAQCLLEFP